MIIFKNSPSSPRSLSSSFSFSRSPRMFTLLTVPKFSYFHRGTKDKAMKIAKEIVKNSEVENFVKQVALGQNNPPTETPTAPTASHSADKPKEESDLKSKPTLGEIQSGNSFDLDPSIKKYTEEIESQRKAQEEKERLSQVVDSIIPREVLNKNLNPITEPVENPKPASLPQSTYNLEKTTPLENHPEEFQSFAKQEFGISYMRKSNQGWGSKLDKLDDSSSPSVISPVIPSNKTTHNPTDNPVDLSSSPLDRSSNLHLKILPFQPPPLLLLLLLLVPGLLILTRVLRKKPRFIMNNAEEPVQMLNFLI